MGITGTLVTQFTDSVSKVISEFSTTFVTNTATGSPSSTTINSGASGVGASNTYGRVLLCNDDVTERDLLADTYASVTNVASYMAGLQSLNGIYQQFFPMFNKIDLATGGLNAFLVTNSLQVSTWFAKGFNYWCTIATQVTPGRTSANAPIAIAAANYFPVAIDTIWNITCGTGTSMTSSAVGVNADSSVGGGGYGQIVIYKSNASNAVGGATFTITYTNTSGVNVTATYTTTSGVPLASGSLAAAYTVSGAIGSKIISVTGTGMTTGEQYTFGIEPIRVIAY